MITNRPLRVFLCHSSNDKPAVRELYQKLRAEAWIEPWLDEEELYPGEDWDLAIQKAVEESDAVLVCLSNNSITKRGYVQKELRFALDIALEMPEEEIFIIPLRLEECEPPRRLRGWQYADYFEGHRERGFQRLLVSLKRRADGLGLMVEKQVAEETPQEVSKSEVKPAQETRLSERLKSLGVKIGTSQLASAKPMSVATSANKLTLSNGMEFMRVPAGEFVMGSSWDDKDAYSNEKPQHAVNIPYDYWMARFPVTNELYNTYVQARGREHPFSRWENHKDHPVVKTSWKDATGYCEWLNNSHKSELPSGLILRLPTEAEWEKAARGNDGYNFPWGNDFDQSNCNTTEGGKGDTTSVRFYSPQGDSPYGCADMAGNVSEWTHSLLKIYPYDPLDGREAENDSRNRVLRGGSLLYDARIARCAYRNDNVIRLLFDFFGFRVTVAPKLSR